MQSVNSELKRLTLAEIVLIGAQNFVESDLPDSNKLSQDDKNKYVQKMVLTAASLANQDNSEGLTIKNTVFICNYHEEKNMAYVEAFNADTPSHFMDNIMHFCQKMKTDRGLQYLVFLGDDMTLRIVKRIAKTPIARGWGVRIEQSSNNAKLYRFIVSLGA